MSFAQIEDEERSIDRLFEDRSLLLDLDGMRRAQVQALLDRHDWRLRDVARELGMTKPGLLRLIRDLDID